MNKKKTVIFGGSFDPIHIGHIALADEVMRAELADEVWFMVSPQNPHKEPGRLTDENIRLEMVRLAVEEKYGIKACDFEFTLPRPSYTINTLQELEKAYPDREFILLIGADNWSVFDRWYKHEEILKRYRIIVYPRDREDNPSLPQGVTWLPSKLYNISSTMIRNAIAAGEDISGLVPQKAEEFINERKLYRQR